MRPTHYTKRRLKASTLGFDVSEKSIESFPNRKRYDLTSVDSLDAIASTIMTPVDESHITCILRQGGLFLVRYRLPEDEGFLQSTGPLSKETLITRLLPEM